MVSFLICKAQDMEKEKDSLSWFHDQCTYSFASKLLFQNPGQITTFVSLAISEQSMNSYKLGFLVKLHAILYDTALEQHVWV